MKKSNYVIGFNVILDSVLYDRYWELGGSMEQLRVDLVRTLLTAKYLGRSAEGGETNQIITGVNQISEMIKDPNKLGFYIREAICCKFLTAILTDDLKTNMLLVYQNELKKDLLSICSHLVTNRFNEFYNNYLGARGGHVRAEAFHRMIDEYAKFIWRN